MRSANDYILLIRQVKNLPRQSDSLQIFPASLNCFNPPVKGVDAPALTTN